MSTSQRYRLSNPATGREIVLEAEPGEIYLDRDTGEPLEVVGKVLPLAPSPSRLPWAVENLRFCPGATSWPRRTSTTAPRAAGAWGRCGSRRGRRVER